jgi:hypothetical protein
MILIMSPLAPVSYILVDVANHDPIFFPEHPAGHILVDLDKHDPDFVPQAGFRKVMREEKLNG